MDKNQCLANEYEILERHIRESLCGRLTKNTANHIAQIVARHLIDNGVTISRGGREAIK